MELIRPDTNFNFVGVRRWAYAFSAVLILVGIVSLIVHGGPNYGVDFAGGSLIQIKFQKPTTAQVIRDALGDLNMGQESIQRFGDPENNEFLVRVSQETEDLNTLSQRVERTLEQKFGQGSLEVRRVETVGPKVGKDLRQKALFAIFYAILFIVIYISGRFELKWLMSLVLALALMLAVYLADLLGAGVTGLILVALVITMVVCFFFQLKFALGAILALMHDVAITVGVFSLLNKEMTLTIVAAILTIIGYSLNDTIVVFDRIRENTRKYRKQNFDRIINSSINETLSRTILTGGTTLIVLGCLYFLGGPVIADFSLALIIGIIIGTYSSIYVASPILLIWPPAGAVVKSKTKRGGWPKAKK